MNFRYWLADLISGGEFGRLRRKDDLNMLVTKYSQDRLTDSWRLLSRIAALETPHANATVRKMAKIARGEA